jgi:hypothetical protein
MVKDGVEDVPRGKEGKDEKAVCIYLCNAPCCADGPAINSRGSQLGATLLRQYDECIGSVSVLPRCHSVPTSRPRYDFSSDRCYCITMRY